MSSLIKRSLKGNVGAQTNGGRHSKEITLDDLLAGKSRKSAAPAETVGRGYAPSFTRATNLGRSRLSMAAPLPKTSS